MPLSLTHDHPHDENSPHEHPPRPVWNGPRITAGFGKLVAGLAAIGLVLLLLSRTLYFVDETEYAYVTQFGLPVRLHASPGMHWKWPYQGLWRFDRRLHLYQPPGREMLTEDKENLNFQWYVCWRIPSRRFVESQVAANTDQGGRNEAALEDATEQYVRRFLQSVGTREAAENRLEERIQAALAAEIGRTRLARLTSLNPADLALVQVADRVLQNVAPAAAEQFGIEVVDVRIQRFHYPEAVKPAVYAEIRSERKRVAVQYRAEGASQKARLESLATLHREQLLAQARRDAARIRGEGEAKAIQIANTAHSHNPRFYEFLKTLETYRSILDDQTTIVLSADSPLLKLLTQGLPPELRNGTAPTAAHSETPADTTKLNGAAPPRRPGDLPETPATGGTSPDPEAP
jgi:modulator of FtsH protease HflC